MYNNSLTCGNKLAIQESTSPPNGAAGNRGSSACSDFWLLAAGDSDSDSTSETYAGSACQGRRQNVLMGVIGANYLIGRATNWHILLSAVTPGAVPQPGAPGRDSIDDPGLGVAVHARGGDVTTQGEVPRHGAGGASCRRPIPRGVASKGRARAGQEVPPARFPLATGSGRPAARRRRQDRW